MSVAIWRALSLTVWEQMVCYLNEWLLYVFSVWEQLFTLLSCHKTSSSWVWRLDPLFESIFGLFRFLKSSFCSYLQPCTFLQISLACCGNIFQGYIFLLFAHFSPHISSIQVSLHHWQRQQMIPSMQNWDFSLFGFIHHWIIELQGSEARLSASVCKAYNL